MTNNEPILSREFYDNISKTYESVYKQRIKYNMAIDTYLSSHVNYRNFKKLLDIGSGSGERITKVFSNHSKIFVVEESSFMCSLLRKNSNIGAVIESDINSLGSESFERDFDLVTMQWNVPGHVRDLISLFQLCYEVLKPGGHLIFDVNNPFNLKAYGIKSIVKNSLFFYLYPRHERKVFDITLLGLKTNVAYSPVRFYRHSLRALGFNEIQVKYFDYDTGETVGRYEGQILIDAIKL